MPQPQGRKLKRPLEQIRAELLADPDTKTIAQAVRMKLEDYVDLVLDYLQNPEKEPIFSVASEEQLKGTGYEPPSTEEVAQFFNSAASGDLGIAGSQFEKSGFESSSEASAARRSSALGATTGQSAPGTAAQPSNPRPDLLDQVKRGTPGGRI